MFKKLISTFMSVMLILLAMPMAGTLSNAATSDFNVINGVLTSYSGSETTIVIPDDLGITSIGNGVFKDHPEITSITIPNGITSIGNNAFENCSSLASITLPESITSIGEWAFSNCDALTTIDLPDGITALNQAVFFHCDNLNSISLPSGLVSLENNSFDLCVKLNNVTLPASLSKIDKSAFSDCYSLSQITLPNSLTAIGENAFWSCNSLSSIIIPSGVKNIGDAAFGNCLKLTSIDVVPENTSFASSTGILYNKNCTKLVSYPSGRSGICSIPNTVISIGDGAFCGNNVLTGVNIPTSVTEIGLSAFEYCEKLTNISIPASVTSIEDAAFFGCKGLTEISLPASLKSIEPYTFYGCSSLSGIVLPSETENIGTNAFTNCRNITGAIIPGKVTNIGDYAFTNCIGLTSLRFLGNAPKVGKDIFKGTTTSLKINYLSRNTGFSNPWCGKTTEALNGDLDKITDFVTRLYQKILNRTASYEEINYYVNDLANNRLTGADIGKNFVFSPEFTNRNLNNSDYIEVLYQTFMNRASDTGGKSYWQNMLNNGVSRLFVFKGFVESIEYTNICSSYNITRGSIALTEPMDQNPNLTMFVYRLYTKALNREPDVSGLNYYAAEIIAKRITPVQAAQNFIFSPEFKNRNLSDAAYIGALYQVFFGREYDQGGLDYYLNLLNTGTGREQLVINFSNSPEFNNIIMSFGL